MIMRLLDFARNDELFLRRTRAAKPPSHTPNFTSLRPTVGSGAI